MFDIKVLQKAIEQLASEKELDAAQIIEAIEAALASAYKKEYNKRGEVVRCALNMKDGSTQFVQIKTVVDETTVRFKQEGEEENPEYSDRRSSDRITHTEEEGEPLLPLYSPERHLLLAEAQLIKSDAKVGDEIEFDLESPSSEFGRIAAQTAKQVILQKLREIEKDSMRKEYESKIGGLVFGIVQRIERGNIFVDMGKASGIMFRTESIPGEHYRIGERLKFFLLSVQDNMRGPNLVLSRSHPRFVAKLFELEVPEVGDGTVQIKGIVREAGSRTKIAVASTADGVDPVGSCVGQRGARVLAVNSELGNEKIDIIEWSEDMEKFVGASLSPATVTSVELTGQREARVLVPEDQISLAIGKGGQNVRLAALLTHFRIDVRSQSNPDQAQEGGVVDAEEVTPISDETEEE
ncbi:MAG: transcription termination factor NusA [Candidatus Paceibacterota bacterium]